MTGESRHHRLESLFLACLDLPAGERGAFLDSHCAGDPALRAQIEDLLRHDAASATPLPVIAAYAFGAKLGEGASAKSTKPSRALPCAVVSRSRF